MFRKNPDVYLTDDVGHGVPGFDLPASLRVDPQSHMHMGETLLIWIVLRVLRQGLNVHTNTHTMIKTSHM